MEQDENGSSEYSAVCTSKNPFVLRKVQNVNVSQDVTSLGTPTGLHDIASIKWPV